MFTPKHILLSLAVVSALSMTAPASADWKTKQVTYADLDLSAPAGRQRLETRVKQAIRQVCGSPSRLTLEERQARLNCEKSAMTRVAPQTEKAIAAFVEKRRLAFDDRSNPGSN